MILLLLMHLFYEPPKNCETALSEKQREIIKEISKKIKDEEK